VKIRVQSHTFHSLWLILNELIKRLITNSHNDGGDLEITFPDAIPLNELFGAIVEHYTVRNEIDKSRKVLDDRTY